MNTESAAGSGLWGTYGGIVEQVADPEQLGRVKVRVPYVYGAAPDTTGYIGTNDIPWALPAGMPAGGSSRSGGFSHLPEIGDHVFVRFLDGEPEKPIWEWGMQTLTDAKNLPLHQYNKSGKRVTTPKRAGWTRYGHTFEMNPDGAIMTTSQGYRVTVTDGAPGANEGIIQIATPNGNLLEIDDGSGTWTVYITEDINLNVIDEVILQARALDFTLFDGVRGAVGTTVDLTAEGNINATSAASVIVEAATAFNATSAGTMLLEAATSLQATFATMRLGDGAVEPFVLGTQLSTFLTQLMTWLSTHIHTSTTPGTPTSPPTIPPSTTVTTQIASLTSQTVFGK